MLLWRVHHCPLWQINSKVHGESFCVYCMWDKNRNRQLSLPMAAWRRWKSCINSRLPTVWFNEVGNSLGIFSQVLLSHVAGRVISFLTSWLNECMACQDAYVCSCIRTLEFEESLWIEWAWAKDSLLFMFILQCPRAFLFNAQQSLKYHLSF